MHAVHFTGSSPVLVCRTTLVGRWYVNGSSVLDAGLTGCTVEQTAKGPRLALSDLSHRWNNTLFHCKNTAGVIFAEILMIVEG